MKAFTANNLSANAFLALIRDIGALMYGMGTPTAAGRFYYKLPEGRYRVRAKYLMNTNKEGTRYIISNWTSFLMVSKLNK